MVPANGYVELDDSHKLTFFPSTFMLGGKSIGVFPVAMSLTVTFLSALTLLGNPVEVYNFNTMFWWLTLGTFFAVAAAAHVFMPFFFRLRITTVFEVAI